MNKRVAVVDDDQKINRMLASRFRKQGFEAVEIYSGQAAIDWILKNDVELVLLDVRLPDMSGVEVLKKLVKKSPRIAVIMISAHADIQMAVNSIKIGAVDFLEKPFEWLALDVKVQQVFQRLTLEEEVSSLRKELGDLYKDKKMIGKSPAMARVLEGIQLAAGSEANVFISGESGTGKELVARAIHYGGIKKSGPFVAVNCSAIPENLLESELFGHEKGSFTGALAQRIGKFEQAQGGTIFLDEIGDLPLALQAKLLRVLQEREIGRVGGSRPVPIHVRFIVATHRNLKQLVSEERFREDLYFRVHVFPIHVPSLRERKEDIPELLHYFFKKFCADSKPASLEPEALKFLMEHPWPGNVRELENFVTRLTLVHKNSNQIRLEDAAALFEKAECALPARLVAAEAEGLSPDHKTQILEEAERRVYEGALKQARGNVTQAAKLINVSRDTFYRKMKKYVLIS